MKLKIFNGILATEAFRLSRGRFVPAQFLFECMVASVSITAPTKPILIPKHFIPCPVLEADI